MSSIQHFIVIIKQTLNTLNETEIALEFFRQCLRGEIQNVLNWQRIHFIEMSKYERSSRN